MDLVNHLPDRLLFAVPKKGRLQQPTLDVLSGSDIQFRRETRLDIALVKNLPIALIFLPAADIPQFVGEGRVDLGITGQDQVEEYVASFNHQWEEGHGLEQILDLGFGKCKLQVQVPEHGDVQRPEQLVGKNVGTSFVGLTKQYFQRLEANQKEQVNGDGGHLQTRVTFVSGSVEAACALGVAHGVVDLVESGETMRAAGLKAIDTVVDSTAVLIRSKRVSNQKLVDLITSRITGFITAQKYVLCTYNAPRAMLEQVKKITPGKRAPTISPLEDDDWCAISSMVEKSRIAVVMDQLSEQGAHDILVMPISNTRA